MRDWSTRFLISLLFLYLSPWSSSDSNSNPVYFVNGAKKPLALTKKCKFNSACASGCCGKNAKGKLICVAPVMDLVLGVPTNCMALLAPGILCNAPADCGVGFGCTCEGVFDPKKKKKGKKTVCGGAHCGEYRCDDDLTPACAAGCDCWPDSTTRTEWWCKVKEAASTALRRTNRQCAGGLIEVGGDCSANYWGCKGLGPCCIYMEATKKYTCIDKYDKTVRFMGGEEKCIGVIAPPAKAAHVAPLAVAQDAGFESGWEANAAEAMNAEANAERLADEGFRMGFKAGLNLKKRND